ncbi:outer membrane autotransporter barrel domain protein, partial [mine drainage metagenome]
IGNVVSSSGSTNGGDTFELGGNINASGGNVFNLASIVSTAPASYSGTPVFYGFMNYAKSGTSTWTLTGTGNASQNWMISGGTLVGSTTSLLGNVTFNTAAGAATPDVTFDQASNGTYAGLISGNGSLTLEGGGGLTLTADNSYSGGTTINAGTLQVGTGGATGAIGAGNVIDNGALVFDLSSGTLVDGVISGSGSLTQMGTGATILDGIDTYTGGTTVSAGTLEIGDATHTNAAIAGNVSVAAGATLRGHGTIGGNVTNAGTVMPGGSLGILTVNGNYTQSSGATLALGVSPQTMAGTGYSQLQVGGTASLAGALLIEPLAGNYAVGSTYDLLHAAGGVSGTFASTFDNPAFAIYLTPQVTYATNDVFLKLNVNPAAFSSGFPNYASTVSLALDSTFQTVLGGFGSAPGMGGITGDARSGAWAQYTGSGGDLGDTRQSMQGGAAGAGTAINAHLVLGAAIASANTATSLAPSRVVGTPLGAFLYGIYRSGGCVWR